jgi:hypothetical protein
VRPLLKRFGVWFRRQPSRFFISAFVAYSVIWTLLESLAFFIPSLKPEGWLAFSGMLIAIGLISLGWGARRVSPPQHIKVRIKAINTTIEVEFGDLFEAQGLKVIPVNEFFDSELGEPVARRSLHGQLIERYFGSHPASFEALVDEELKDETSETITRKDGRDKRYPIGTTPVIKVGEDRYFLTALCHTDPSTCKACCDVPTLWRALTGLWSAVRIRAGGDPVSVPLIGGGLSGIGLPPFQLLQLILLSIVSANKESHIASTIHIVLPRDSFEEIDLNALVSHWS